MDKPWFDVATGTVLLDDYVLERESYKKITADNQVTEAELQAQSQTVIRLLRQLENMLPAEAKIVATDALCELAVLHNLRARHDAAS